MGSQFIHTYLLNTHCMVDTVLGVQKKVYEKDKVCVLMELTLCWNEINLFCLLCQVMRSPIMKNRLREDCSSSWKQLCAVLEIIKV